MRVAATRVLLAIVFASAPWLGATEIASPALFRQLDANADGRLTLAEAGEQHGLLFKRMLRTGDENGDGVLAPYEFDLALQPTRAEKAAVEKEGSRLPGADALTVLLARMDADGNSRVQRQEVPGEYRPAYEQMAQVADADGDDALDAREIARAAPRLSLQAQAAAVRLRLDVSAELQKLPHRARVAVEAMGSRQNLAQVLADPQQAGELFQRLDADVDGRLAADEVPPQNRDVFERMLRRGDRDGDGKLSEGEFITISRRLERLQRQGNGSKIPADDAKKRQGGNAQTGSE